MKESSGTLLYREGPDGLEVLLVHASGNFNRSAPWGIPKGVLDMTGDLETNARRETLEETGVEPGELFYLGEMVYKKSRKRVHCFGGPAPEGAKPTPNCWEVDGAKFLPIENARAMIHPDQAVFLDMLLEHLK
jgi:predicted NUDIX family NTP pyrophosphohydrolase